MASHNAPMFPGVFPMASRRIVPMASSIRHVTSSPRNMTAGINIWEDMAGTSMGVAVISCWDCEIAGHACCPQPELLLSVFLFEVS